MLARQMLSTARGGAVERVVIRRVDVAEVVDIGRQRLVAPAVAAEQKRRSGSDAAGSRKNSSTRASRSGRRLASNPRSASKRGIRRGGVMRVGIERVVDREARFRAE